MDKKESVMGKNLQINNLSTWGLEKEVLIFFFFSQYVLDA